jgi:thioesterase domain-containing protein
MTGWLLVHSPLLGPGSWAPVAAELRDAGDTVVVPDLRPALSDSSGYAQRQAALAAEAAPAGPFVLAGHSGAGPLLPSVVAALAERGVDAGRCILVDAGLPHPERSRRSTLPAELADHLDALTEDGMLPPWPRWWSADELAAVLPDPAARATLEADSPPLPAQLFAEPLPPHDALPTAGYLQLSDTYAEGAASAAADGWPVRKLAADHLALLTSPSKVARAMRDVAADATPLRNAARAHVARFNRAVRDGNWTVFTDRFAEDATMRFTNVPVGPFAGRDEILRGYLQQSPDDTMTIRSLAETGPDAVDVAFAWDASGTGTMRTRWVDGLVADLAITFG